MRRWSLKFLTKEMYELFKRDQERRGAPVVNGTPEVGAKPPSVSSSTEKWTKNQTSSLRKSRRNPLSLSHESLVVLDQDPLQQKLASASSVNSIVNHVKAAEQDEEGRVASWAVSFEKLLRDPVGITVFTDFLKKEFSEENVEFWKACEDFKSIIDSNYRKSKAKEIYDKHVSVRASDCVNIDSVARKTVEEQLENPTPQTFDVPQKQIFQLMKQDSYARFLKSDLYKSYVMDEMEGKPLRVADDTPQDRMLDKALEKDSKKKGKGKENEEKSEKRRRSLLPWRQKSKKQSKSDSDAKKTVKETKDINANTTPSVSTASVDTTSSSKKDVIVEVPETIEEEEPEQPKFCRVIMPDGSTTVVGTRQGQTINYILGKLCEKRGLSIASVDVFLLGSEKPLNLNDDITTLGSKEITIERRVLFRMDLPNKKSIGVKAKPNRLIRDVFKPILNKYGYRMDAIDVHLSGHADNLCLDNLVSTIDSQRVIVLNQAPDLPDPDNSPKVRVEKVMIAEVHPSLDSCEPGTDKQGAEGALTKDLGKAGKSRQKVTFDLKKNTVRSQQDDNVPGLQFERLRRVQNFSLDGRDLARTQDLVQRGFPQGNVDDVLTTGRESAPASLGSGNDDLSTHKHSRDFMAEIDSYIESINENFAAYTRKSTPTKQNSNQTDENSLPLQFENRSFSEDGIVPSSEEANDLFQVPHSTNDVNFDDSQLTEKSLTDIGFNYSHNKYLLKSRNFVNQRKTNLNATLPNDVQREDLPSASDTFSPNQTLRSDVLNQSDLLDATLLNSPRSSPSRSPYSSDSSLDKENLGKHVPKSKNSVQRTSRHTLIHSPLHSPMTGTDGDSFLSTVDTDGKLARHSTPKAPQSGKLSSAGRTPKRLNSNSDKHIADISHTDEVTFV